MFNRKKIGLGIRIAVILTLALSLTSFVWAGDVKPGKARWPIKTSVPDNANLDKPTRVEFSKLLSLEAPADVTKNDKRYQSNRIPPFANSLHVKEGDIITVRGWLHLVAAESDGDYHIQISGNSDSGDNCLIVEVPTPDREFVNSDNIIASSDKVRSFIKDKMLRGKEPSKTGSVMKHPAYVQVTGQLFYDDSHVGDQPRGKKGMKAATLWEIHPVTDISFANPPSDK